MATEYLYPNAAGDETSINDEIPDEEAHWSLVDEATPDDDSTYVYNNGVVGYQRDLYNLPASSIPDGSTINFLKIYFRCSGVGTSGTRYAKPSLKSDSTVTDGTEVVLSGDGTWETFSEPWNTNPADSEAWEKADIDSLQIGVSLKSAVGSRYARCTQVYVEVDYTAGATEKTSSDAGSGVDAVDYLQTPQAKTSSDAGSGAEGTPLSSATLAGSENGSGIEALFARLLAAFDIGTGTEAGGLQYDKELTATETAEGSDRLTAKIEIPTKGGGMKLWT